MKMTSTSSRKQKRNIMRIYELILRISAGARACARHAHQNQNQNGNSNEMKDGLGESSKQQASATRQAAKSIFFLNCMLLFY